VTGRALRPRERGGHGTIAGVAAAPAGRRGPRQRQCLQGTRPLLPLRFLKGWIIVKCRCATAASAVESTSVEPLIWCTRPSISAGARSASGPSIINLGVGIAAAESARGLLRQCFGALVIHNGNGLGEADVERPDGVETPERPRKAISGERNPANEPDCSCTRNFRISLLFPNHRKRGSVDGPAAWGRHQSCGPPRLYTTVVEEPHGSIKSLTKAITLKDLGAQERTRTSTACTTGT
jgi:hypothetical protein